MGVTASREFSDAVASCVNQGRGLESLLEDSEVFVNRWKTPYQALPRKAQKSFGGLAPRLSPKKRGETYLSKVQKVQAKDIGIPKRLKPIYSSWKRPTTFFNQFARLKGASTVSQVYEELRHIDRRQVDDPIRTRIYAVALHDLRLLVDQDPSLQLRPNVKEKIAQVISDSPVVGDSLTDVAKWTTLYLKFGERMKEIAVNNGGLGALIVTPSLLTPHQWAKKINDDDLKRCISHLQSIGVNKTADEAGAHAVAHRIHSFILQKFSSSIKDPNANHEELILDEEAEEEEAEEEQADREADEEAGEEPEEEPEEESEQEAEEEPEEESEQEAEEEPEQEPEQEHKGSSKASNDALSAHGVHGGREHFCQAGIEAGERLPPNALTLAFDSRPSNENGQRNHGYNSTATVPLQKTPSNPFLTTVVGTQPRYYSGRATNTAEGFDSRSHTLIGDASTNFHSQSYTHSRIPSIGTQSQGDVFDPGEYYTGGNPNPSFDTLSQQQFDPSEHYTGGNLSFNTLSQQQFDPGEYYTGGNPSFDILSQQQVDSGQMGNFDTSYYV